MNKFIVVTNVHGRETLVNVSAIAQVDNKGGVAVITLKNGNLVYTSSTYEVLFAILTEENS